MAEILVASLGVIFLIIGMVAYKYPKAYLEFFGAGIIIFLSGPKGRIETMKVIGYLP